MKNNQSNTETFTEQLSSSVRETYKSTITKAITWVIIFQWSEAIKQSILKLDPKKKFALVYPIVFTLIGAILITLIELI